MDGKKFSWGALATIIATVCTLIALLIDLFGLSPHTAYKNGSAISIQNVDGSWILGVSVTYSGRDTLSGAKMYVQVENKTGVSTKTTHNIGNLYENKQVALKINLNSEAISVSVCLTGKPGFPWKRSWSLFKGNFEIPHYSPFGGGRGDLEQVASENVGLWDFWSPECIRD